MSSQIMSAHLQTDLFFSAEILLDNHGFRDAFYLPFVCISLSFCGSTDTTTGCVTKKRTRLPVIICSVQNDSLLKE